MTVRLGTVLVAFLAIAIYATLAAVHACARERATRQYAARLDLLIAFGARAYSDMQENELSTPPPRLDSTCAGHLERGEPGSIAAYIAGRTSQAQAQLSFAARAGTLVGVDSMSVGISTIERSDLSIPGFFEAWTDMLGTWPTQWGERESIYLSLTPAVARVRYLAVVSVDVALGPREGAPGTFDSGEAALRVRVIDVDHGETVCEGLTIARMPKQVRQYAGGSTNAEASANLMMGTPAALTSAFSVAIEMAPLGVLCRDASPALCQLVAARTR